MLAQGVSSPSVTSLVQVDSSSSSSTAPETIRLIEVPVVSSAESSAPNNLPPVPELNVGPNPVPVVTPAPKSKPKKKSRKVNPGTLNSPQKLAVENSNNCEIVIESVTSLAQGGAASATTSSGIGGGGRKRSRKQEISRFLTDEISLISPPSVAVPTGKGGKRKRSATAGKKAIDKKVKVESENVKQSSQQLNIVKRVNNSSTKTASSLFKQIKKNKTVKQKVEAKGPEPKIVLNKSDLVSVIKPFQVFLDPSRDIPAIGPGQVVLAAETLIETGCEEDLIRKDSDNNNAVVAEPSEAKGIPTEPTSLFSKYLSSPHFLPLSTVYSPGVPFTRILKFSALLEFTGGFEQKNSTQTFRFLHGQQLTSVDSGSNHKGEGYLRNTIVIKYPILGKFSQGARYLKFFVLKKVKVQGTEVAVLKAKVVKIQRTEDKKNILIKTDETSISELPSDANAMSQQNIQPVIHTENDLVPFINRTTTGYLQQPQPHYQTVIQAQPQYQHHQQQPHFQYVSYRYQTASDLTHAYESEPAATVSTNILNYNETPSNSYNYLNQPCGNSHITAEITTDEHGNQILILIDPHQQSNLNQTYLQELPYNQQHQHHQLQPQEQYQVVHHHQGGNTYQQTLPVQSQVVVPHQNQQTQQSNFYPLQQQQGQVPSQQYNSTLSQAGTRIVCLDNNTNTGYSIQLVAPSPKDVILSNNQVQQVQQTKQSLQPVRIDVQSQTQNVGQQNQHQVIVQPAVVQQQSQVPSIHQIQQQQVQQGIPIQQQQHTLVQAQQHPKTQYPSVIQKPLQTYQPATRPHLPQHHQPVISQNPGLSQQYLLAGPSSIQPNIYHSNIQNQLIPPPPPVPVPNPVSVSGAIASSTLKPTKPKTKKEPKGKKNKNNDINCSTPLNSVPQGGLQLPQPSTASVISTATTAPVVQPLASVSRTSDFVRISSGSHLPNSVEQELAGKLHSLQQQPLTAGTAAANSHIAVSPTKTLVIVPSSPNSNSLNKDASLSSNLLQSIITAQPTDNRPNRKPGFLAVCQWCGYSQGNILRCVRCKVEFPDNVKLIPDQWRVNTSEVTLAAVPPSTPTSTPVSASENKKTPANSAVNKKPPAKKVIVVNRPTILNPSARVITGNTVVQVKPQPDGGTSVTVIPGVGSGAKGPVIKGTPIPKKRAAPRRRIQECITLSSDDEEPELPKPKIVKVESSNTAVTESNTNNNCEKSDIISGDSSSVAQSGAVSQAPVQEKVQEVSEKLSFPLPDPVTPDNSDMAKKIGMSINLSPPELVVQGKPKDEDTPEKVLEKIESEMIDPGSKFEYATISCRSIRVGSYKVTDNDTGPLKVTLTALGIMFTLPYSHSKIRKVKVCIPRNNILSIQANLTKRLPVIFLKTGPKFAKWVRDVLGMDGNPDNDYTNYYCPQKGSSCQRTITILAESFSEADVGLVRKMYVDTLTEIDYQMANKFLMDITPETYKTSINYQPDSDSPAAKVSASASKKVDASSSSSSSVVPSSQPPSSSQNNNATGDRPSANSTQSLGTTTGSSAKVEYDQEATIWSYEGNIAKIPISPKDISCLGHSQFLNDQIIDFWLSVIYTELLSENDRQRTFVFDSFFYTKLTEKKKKTPEDGALTAPERRHARVKKRTKNVDIFDKDFLIVPINENYHWFIVIICFPGMQGYHDYETLEPVLNYSAKKPKLLAPNAKDKKPKPIVSKQPQNDTTAAYSERDEAPEDPDEAKELNNLELASSEEPQSSPSRPETGTETLKKGAADTGGVKRKLEASQTKPRVKHPCILLFDSLAGDPKARIFSTLREYLKIEYKTKKGVDRVFDKHAIPGLIPKVPQQPNFSDCGLFMLQYIESFFSHPLHTYDITGIHLKSWFEPLLAENKRREIFAFIHKKIEEKCPHHLDRIPDVNFDEADNCEVNSDGHMSMRSLDSSWDEEDDDDDPDYDDDDDLFEKVTTTTTSNEKGNVKPVKTPTSTRTPVTTSTTTPAVARPSPARPANSSNSIMITLTLPTTALPHSK